MSETTSIRPASVLRALALMGGFAAIATYIFVALSRIGYPFELEWMEGGAVDHVRRILDGRPLYVPPSLSFIPYIYTPLYFYVSAAVAKVIGVGFLPLRLVSFASSIGCLVMIGLIVRSETREWGPAWIAAGLFAATYRLSGAWFDLARVDSLSLLLLLGGIHLIRHRRSALSWAASGLLLGLAFLTKQSVLPVVAAVSLFGILADRRRSLVLILCGWGLIGGSTLVLNRIHAGWYAYYVFDLPSEHPIVPKMVPGFWLKDILRPLPIALVLAGAWLLARGNAGREKRLFHLLLGLGMIGTSYSSRLHLGGYDNVLMLAHAYLAIGAGLGIHAVSLRWREVAARRTSQGNPSHARRSFAGRPEILHAAVVFQFALLLYNPARQIPTPADVAAGRHLLETVGSLRGEVFMVSHGYLPFLAGKETHAHLMAIRDVLRGRGGQIKEGLVREILGALDGRRFGAVVIDAADFGDDPSDRDWQEPLARDFEPPLPFFYDKTVFWTLTGLRTRPEMLFVRRAGEGG